MKSPESKIFFIRHGENENDQSKNSHEQGLSDLGIEESTKIGKKIDIDSTVVAAFHTDNIRSLQTVILSLYPNISKQELDSLTYNHNQERINPYSKLTYDASDDIDFCNALVKSSIQKRTLEFLINESDEYRSRSNVDITSYSVAAADVAKIILKYIRLHNVKSKKDDLIEKKNDVLQRIFCAREFIFPCFRVKVTALTLGNDEAQKYVDWYENNIEGKDKSREEISKIIIQTTDDENNITLSDSYGELHFSVITLESIIKEFDLKFEKLRVGAYLIPVDENKRVALIKYPDGYGFIGGGVKTGESLMTALQREVREELDLVIPKDKIVRIEKPYSFFMGANKRTNYPPHKENHFFYITPISSSDPITFHESKSNVIEWVTIEELCSPKIIKYTELAKYLSECIIPIINEACETN